MSNINFNKELTTSEYAFLSYLFKNEQDISHSLFVEKNARYEASFFKQCEEDNDLSSLVIRLTDKVNRIKALVKNPDLNPLDESIKDTLRDLSNYATMGLVYLEVLERDSQGGTTENACE